MDQLGQICCLVYLMLLLEPLAAEVTSNHQCSGSTTKGSASVLSAATTGPDPGLAFTYMVESPNYVFTCCGVVTQWQAQLGRIGTIQFHVWRRTSTNVYELIGENIFAATATGTNTFNVDVEKRIVVQKGDYIGWHHQGDDMLMYQSTDFVASTLDNFFRRINAGDLVPGDTYDWSTVEAYNDRDFGLKVTFTASTAPTFTLTPAAATVPDYLLAGAPVASFIYSDADTSDNSSLTIYEKQSSILFSVNLAAGKVTANTAYRPRDTTLKYFVYDQCYNSAETTQTITVSQTNLVFDNLDADFAVAKSTTAQTLFHTLSVTDYTDQWYCYSGWSTTLPFMLKALSNVSYGFYLTEHADLSNPSYTSLTVSCVENRVSDQQTYTANYNVYVTKNYPPNIDNLDASATVDAETALKGDTVFTVNATDTEGDVVEFTMTCTGQQNAGATCPFVMMKNGNIQVNASLLFDTNSQYELVVTATDSDSNTDTGTVLVTIASIDHAITITSYPAAGLQVQENEPLGTSLYTFEYEDLDDDTKKWSVSYSNDILTRHFSLDPDTGLFSTAYLTIDFEESGGTHTATVLVGDVQSTMTQNVEITIINENEAPRFPQDTYHLEVDEAADGTVITDGASLFNADDVDTPDTKSYYLDCDSSSALQRFYMTEGTGAIAYKGAMDIETSGTPTDYDCTVTVVDTAGLNDTTSLYIHILNVNEHIPEFTKTDYTIYLPVNILVGTSVLEVLAIDHDSADDDDNEITYSLDQSNYGANIYFAINHVGVIYTAKEMSAFSFSPSTFLALSANLGATCGGNPCTGTTTISVEIALTTTTVTTTTDKNSGFYDDMWTYYWMLLTLVGVFCMILAISLVCYRICRLTRIQPWCYNFWMSTPCCRPKPPRPRGFGDKGYDLASFGHKHAYADEDEEIDGWLKRARRTGQGYKSERPMSGGPVPVIVESDGRLSSPMTYGDEQQRPLHELMRVNNGGAIPKPAGYREPIPKKSIMSKWKGTHRNRGSILKNAPSSWNT